LYPQSPAVRMTLSALPFKDPPPSVIKMRPQEVKIQRRDAVAPSFTFNDLPPYNPRIPR
jgi:hypothetical protein